MSEYMISNHEQTLAVNLEDGSWRVLDLPLQAMNFEHDTGLHIASFDGKVQILEDEGVLSDDGIPIPYEFETPSVTAETGQVGLVTMIYLDINTRGQVLQVLLRIDNDILQLEPLLATNGRQLVEYPVSPQGQRRTFSVRLLGDLTNRVDVFGIEMDIDWAPAARNQ